MKNNAWIRMTPEELAEHIKAFEESIELVIKNGEDL